MAILSRDHKVSILAPLTDVSKFKGTSTCAGNFKICVEMGLRL